MNITPDIVKYEFIGLEIKVVHSSNPYVVGISGRVVDETHNTITISKNGKRKVIVKDTAIFNVVMQNGTVVEINGKVIMGRSEDRIKKRLRRIW